MSVVRRLLQGSISSPSQLILGCRSLSNHAAAALQVSNDSNPVGTPDKLFKKITIELKGHEKAVLKSYTTVLKAAATNLDIPSDEIVLVPKATYNRLTLLRSVHIYKKHRVQYEMRTYHASLTLRRLTGSTADTYLEYVQRMLPEGVGMKVSKTEIHPTPNYMQQPSA
ncbi:small ribosomal subunit protein uS10m [Neocloeon triangulifer]|uniref:small ribosomal subunit protein uS10m n=1 Tax=Neocloeon triangulifer TaxID=2078957 RepID=UPI00286FA6C4|nr:small ribosomal subunit protein uS10m [Neocloeon triangulifer]